MILTNRAACDATPRCMCPRPAVMFDPHQGERLCGRCGTVMESRLADFHLQDSAPRGAGREDWGVGTMLPGDPGVATVAARRGRRGARLSRLLGVLRRMAESAGVGGAVSEEAYAVCRILVASGHTAWRDKTVMAAAILMLACRTRGRVLRWSEVPGLAGKTRRAMKAYRRLQYAPVPTPRHYTEALISRICTDLGLPVCRARKAMDILDGMRTAAFTGGRKPQCVAAAAVVLAGSGRPYKRAVAHAAGVSEPGLRGLLAAWDKAAP